MKKAIIYSLIFHLLIFTLLTLIQKTLKPAQILEDRVSVLILPPQQKSFEKKEIPKEKGKIEKIPPIKKAQEPKKFSSIPKGSNNVPLDKQDKVDTEKNKFDKLKSFEKTGKEPDIFDRDVISKLSKNKAVNKEMESSQGLSFSTKEFNDWGYLQRLKEKIERVWQYPPQAAERGIFGDLYIKFSIDKKGKLISIELVRTSGYRMLDDAAIKALKDAQPFWPLPEDWQKESLTITGHFIYTLRGFYLR